MSKLNQLITELCPNGIEYKPIGSFANCFPGATPKTNKLEYWANGTIPWMSSGEVNQGEVRYTEKKITQLGYDNTSTKMVPPNTVVIALAGQGKTRGTVAITRIPLCTNQSLCAIVTDDTVLDEYLLHYLRSQYQRLRDISSGDGTRGGLNLKMINSYLVPVPPLPIQHEIVRILDKFTITGLTDVIKAELVARQKQYEYYKNYLFDSINNASQTTIKEVTTDRFWLMPATPQFEQNGVPYITSKNIRNGVIDFSDTKYISSEDYEKISKNRNIQTDDLLITMIGTIGEMAIVDNFTHFYGQNMYLLRFDKNKCLNKYFYYFLSLERIKSSLVSKKNASSQGYIKAGNIENLVFPLPAIEVQRRIVNILDQFNALCNDIGNGLPAEIVARQKQYEYYRNKLFSFGS